MRYKKQLGHTVEYSLFVALLGIALAIILPRLEPHALSIVLKVFELTFVGFILIILPNLLPKNAKYRRFLFCLSVLVSAFILLILLVYL